MSQADEGLHFFRNRMPQWRMDGGIYFVTWCLEHKADELAPAERDIVADCIRFHHRERYDLGIFVVMDDHVHVLVQMRPKAGLGTALKSRKGITSRRIHLARASEGALWEKDSHTELLGHPAAVDSRREYIWNNPASRWGIDSAEYPWLECFE